MLGEIREQQMKFKAPHPLNMIAPLVMIELRQVGYIEVSLRLDRRAEGLRVLNSSSG